MPLRAIDFHVHLPTPDWLDGSMAGYVEALDLPPEVMTAVLHDNAARVLRL